MTKSTIALLTCLLVAAASCESTQPCDLCVVTAVVYGRVVSPSGASVVDLHVRAITHMDSTDCSGAATGASDGGAFLAADGRYRISAVSPHAPGPACVEVAVSRAGSATPLARVVAGVVRLRASGLIPLDSLHLDVAIP